MDGEDSQGSPLPPRVENRAQVDNALRAIHQKKPVPEIDFTLHTMEDGTQVSTMERVCKGTLPLFYPAAGGRALLWCLTD
jgi:serine/threonine-protein phosphatase 2B catalytic subunit